MPKSFSKRDVLYHTPMSFFSLVTVKVWLSTAQVGRRRVTELVLDLHKNSLPRCLVCAWSQTYVDLDTWLLQDAVNSFELADEKRERAAAGQGFGPADPRHRNVTRNNAQNFANSVVMRVSLTDM